MKTIRPGRPARETTPGRPVPYVHLSLDLWLTIIRSDPGYKPARNRAFAAAFGITGRDAEVDGVFREQDVLYNAHNEQSGGQLSLDVMYGGILAALGHPAQDYAGQVFPAFLRECEALLRAYPPRLLDDRLPQVLRQLREGGVTISLLSNTGFISGRSLRPVLQQLGLEDLFDFQLYSDEEGESKPSPALFGKLYDRALLLRPLRREEILHVGDNPLADVAGAEAAGMTGMLFDRERETLSALLLRIFAPVLRYQDDH